MSQKWMNEANCVGQPQEIFFDGYLQSLEMAVEAVTTCSDCPVISRCLEYGKATKSYGIWGGRWLVAGVIKTEQEIDMSDKQVIDLINGGIDGRI